ncbi:putative serine/threonine-protein kinase/receptor [Smittium culicis]|uniref:Putative serine/threonine-protein kinase/receptor n=1 Tax=Smittium culicis TaxID=133412 RepID=A0A1R1YDC1_9FUNG|nr:putative serine/threonine-protein kinase/receptor [Smittium culicis]
MTLIHDIAIGLSYLHSRQPSIIHRDLKPINILVTLDKRAKITDFGLSKIREKRGTQLHTICGTLNWQAPEFWSKNPVYTEKVDVYACALIFWEILKWTPGLYPYKNMKESEIYYQVKKNNHRPSFDNLSDCPAELIELTKKMWASSPESRPTMSKVVDQLNEYFK